MARKQKRKTSAATVQKYPRMETAPKAVNQSRSASTEFNPDYGPVKRDLKRIGILAGSFITILIVLSFFLR